MEEINDENFKKILENVKETNDKIAIAKTYQYLLTTLCTIPTKKQEEINLFIFLQAKHSNYSLDLLEVLIYSILKNKIKLKETPIHISHLRRLYIAQTVLQNKEITNYFKYIYDLKEEEFLEKCIFDIFTFIQIYFLQGIFRIEDHSLNLLIHLYSLNSNRFINAMNSIVLTICKNLKNTKISEDILYLIEYMKKLQIIMNMTNILKGFSTSGQVKDRIGSIKLMFHLFKNQNTISYLLKNVLMIDQAADVRELCIDIIKEFLETENLSEENEKDLNDKIQKLIKLDPNKKVRFKSLKLFCEIISKEKDSVHILILKCIDNEEKIRKYSLEKLISMDIDLLIDEKMFHSNLKKIILLGIKDENLMIRELSEKLCNVLLLTFSFKMF